MEGWRHIDPWCVTPREAAQNLSVRLVKRQSYYCACHSGGLAGQNQELAGKCRQRGYARKKGPAGWRALFNNWLLQQKR
jgi:hypothetical protein